MPEKELSAIPGWKVEYPNNNIAGKEVKVIAVSEKAQLPDLALLREVYGVEFDLDLSRFVEPAPGTEKTVFIKGLEGDRLRYCLRISRLSRGRL